MSGPENPTPDIEEFYHSSERFYELAETITHRVVPHSIEHRPLEGEQMVDWWSIDRSHYYVLHSIENEPRDEWFFEDHRYTPEGSTPSTYYVGAESDYEIRQLDTDGTIIDTPEANQFAASRVLTILAAKLPKKAASQLHDYYENDFWRIAGSYVLNEPELRDEILRTSMLESDEQRAAAIRQLSQKALTDFDHVVKQITRDEKIISDQRNYTPLGQQVLTAIYVFDARYQEYTEAAARTIVDTLQSRHMATTNRSDSPSLLGALSGKQWRLSPLFKSVRPRNFIPLARYHRDQ